jgi:hypothetical protein
VLICNISFSLVTVLVLSWEFPIIKCCEFNDPCPVSVTSTVLSLGLQMEVEKWLEDLQERGSQLPHDHGITQSGTVAFSRVADQ